MWQHQVSYGEDSAVNAQTIKKLQLLEDTVKENFYLSEVTNEQLEDGMFRGLMDSLDDPYSEYYTAEELNELTEQTQGIYFGIGAYVSMDSETNLPKISGVSKEHRQLMWICVPTILSMKWTVSPLQVRR